MTGKIGDHNLRFGRGPEKLADKLGIRILQVKEGQIQPQIRQFLDPLCPPCYSNFGIRLLKFPFSLQYFSHVRSAASMMRNSV